ncbi:hypothetical protein ACFUIY_10890 [Streptomyces griseorubiginosus]
MTTHDPSSGFIHIYYGFAMRQTPDPLSIRTGTIPIGTPPDS